MLYGAQYWTTSSRLWHPLRDSQAPEYDVPGQYSSLLSAQCSGKPCFASVCAVASRRLAETIRPLRSQPPVMQLSPYQRIRDCASSQPLHPNARQALHERIPLRIQHHPPCNFLPLLKESCLTTSTSTTRTLAHIPLPAAGAAPGMSGSYPAT